MFRSSHFSFLVPFGNEVTKIQKYYITFVYILQDKMGKTEKKERKSRNWSNYVQSKKMYQVFCSSHILVLWFFDHFSIVIFFPSCPSCLAKCKQRLRNIFLTLSPKVTKNQNRKNGMNETLSTRISVANKGSVILHYILWNYTWCQMWWWLKFIWVSCFGSWCKSGIYIFEQ